MPASASQSHLTLTAGLTATRSAAVGVGPQNSDDAEEMVVNGLLRVDPLVTVTATARVLCGDGTVIGPVDLPLRLVCPMPVQVDVTPQVAPTRDVIIAVGASVHPPGAEKDAHLTANVAVGGVVELPRGAYRATIAAAGAWGIWLSDAGAALATFTGESAPHAGAASLSVGGVPSDVSIYCR